MKNSIFGFIVVLIFCFFSFSCDANESKNSVIGRWIFVEDDDSVYVFTFTDNEFNTLFLGDDKAKAADYKIEREKIYIVTSEGDQHEWNYKFQDEDTFEINIEIDQRYFIGKRVKNNVTTLDGIYRIVNGVGTIYSFEFVDHSHVKIQWADIHGEFIINDSTYKINETSVILSSEILRRDLEIVGDSILLITGMPNDTIAVFEKKYEP